MFCSVDGYRQQACYVNNNVCGPSDSCGGTFDRYSDFLQHQIWDVLPFVTCCKLSNNCDLYKKYRPVSPNCDPRTPPPGNVIIMLLLRRLYNSLIVNT